MSRPSTRQHRLPKRTGDYKLIPAPLDLSLPLVAEKSPLPAIIVTPSSPSHTRDFAIAFLAAPPPLPLRQRLALVFPSFKYPELGLNFKRVPNPSTRSRALLFLALILVLLAAHFITATLSSRYPQFEFVVQGVASAGEGVGEDGGLAWFTRSGEIVRGVPEVSAVAAAVVATTAAAPATAAVSPL